MNGPAVSAVSGNTSGGGLGSPALSPVDANHHDSREFEFAEAKRLSEIPEGKKIDVEIETENHRLTRALFFIPPSRGTLYEIK